jgi:tubulin---tyrosine ligase
MSAALSRVRAIALSYGSFGHPAKDLGPAAHELALKIIKALWDDWGRDEESDGLSQFVLEHMDQEKARSILLEHERGKRDGEVDLYTLNIPLVPELAQEGGIKVAWTRFWRNEYGKLFKQGIMEKDKETKDATEASNATKTPGDLVFSFSPDWTDIINPDKDTLPYGTDAWAIHSALSSLFTFLCFFSP